MCILEVAGTCQNPGIVNHPRTDIQPAHLYIRKLLGEFQNPASGTAANIEHVVEAQEDLFRLFWQQTTHGSGDRAV